jgi:8-oxo-dGTP diphosphatase
MQLSQTNGQALRRRPSSRLLIVDPAGHVLLFRLNHTEGPLAGQAYWATPGGGLDADETFSEAAIRELREETGLLVTTVGPEVAQREVEFQLPDGEHVIGEERYFLVRVEDRIVKQDLWTAHERQVMTAHRWWSLDELVTATDVIWPERLARLLGDALDTSR